MEACWAHNPEVRGSKPRSAKHFLHAPASLFFYRFGQFVTIVIFLGTGIKFLKITSKKYTYEYYNVLVLTGIDVFNISQFLNPYCRNIACRISLFLQKFIKLTKRDNTKFKCYLFSNNNQKPTRRGNVK